MAERVTTNKGCVRFETETSRIINTDLVCCCIVYENKNILPYIYLERLCVKCKISEQNCTFGERLRLFFKITLAREEVLLHSTIYELIYLLCLS